MTLRHDLLEQAARLALSEPRKPKQASLRRAVSAAYYALFHLLTSDGATRLAPARLPSLRDQVRRAYAHGTMRDVCKSFHDGHIAAANGRQPGQPPPSTRKLIALPLAPELFGVVRAFLTLQEARHDADYDLAATFNRIDMLNLLQLARQAFADWAAVRRSDEATVFLTALLLQKSWGR